MGSVSYSCPAFNSVLPQTQLTNAQDTSHIKIKFIITQYNFSSIVTKTYINGSAQDYNRLYLRFLRLSLKNYGSSHYLRGDIRLRICTLQPVLQDQASSIPVVQLQTFSVLLKEKKKKKNPTTSP